MHLPNKIIINKLILILLVFVLLISSTTAIINYYQNRNEQIRISELNDEFLDLISMGSFESSLVLWPEVYTAAKENHLFLNAFSDQLYEVFYKYYNEKYILNNSNTISLFETSRIYFDFITAENFNKLTLDIYEQYFNETISYDTFLAAENDFARISRYTSGNISDILNNALQIQKAREIYKNAVFIAESETHDYQTAINNLKLINPNDTVYYPMAIDKIDEYIIKLRDEVKNFSD